MITIISFGLLQLLVSGYSCWRGGAPERIVGITLFLATIASIVASLTPSFTYWSINRPLLEIDLLLLTALIAVALVADRYWPMWIAAVHLVAIGSHFVRVYDPAILPIAYWWLATKLGYPMLAILAAGTYRHWQRSRARPEWAWTWQRLRHERDPGLARSDGAPG